MLGPQGPAGNDMLGPGGSPEPASPTKQHALRRILRHKLTILAGALAVAIPAIAAIWTLMKPMYQAAGQVRVSPIIPQVIFATNSNGTIPYYEAYMNTQVSVIRSPTVLSRVLDQPEVQATNWYKKPAPWYRRSKPSPLERLQEDLVVTPRGKTELIDVSIKTGSGKGSAIIVNEILDHYIRFNNESTDNQANQTFLLLVKEKENLNSQVTLGEGQVDVLKRDLGTDDPGELLARQRGRLDETQSRLRELGIELKKAQFQHQELVKRQAGAAPRPVSDNGTADAQPAKSAEPSFESDPEWVRRYVAVRQGRLQVEQYEASMGENNQTLINARMQLKLAEDLLKEREQTLKELINSAGPAAISAIAVISPADPRVTLDQSIDGVQMLIDQLDFEQTLVGDLLAKQQSEWSSTLDKAQTLKSKMDALAKVKEEYNHVSGEVRRKQVESNAPGSIVVLARAVPGDSPSGDRRAMLTLLALLAGLGMGVGLAYLRSGADPTIFEAQELVDSAPVPFLGQLPRVAAKRDVPPLDDPMLNEGIRMVRTPLLQRIGKQQGNVVLITSAAAGDGKTTVSVMLARSLAQCGKRVLLVDADLRNPHVCSHLGIQTETGLVQILADQIDETTAIINTDTPQLSVLPAGRLEGALNLELITNGAFSTAIRRWSEQFDVVLLDSSPVLPVADTRILAHHADGTILVVWAEKTRRSEAMEALSLLDAAGGRLWGTVFIGSPRKRGYGYASSYYTYGHGGRS